MVLLREGDCDGALGAVFVMGDGEMLDLIETQCPVAVSDLARWELEFGETPSPWRSDRIVTHQPEPGD